MPFSASVYLCFLPSPFLRRSNRLLCLRLFWRAFDVVCSDGFDKQMESRPNLHLDGGRPETTGARTKRIWSGIRKESNSSTGAVRDVGRCFKSGLLITDTSDAVTVHRQDYDILHCKAVHVVDNQQAKLPCL